MTTPADPDRPTPDAAPTAEHPAAAAAAAADEGSVGGPPSYGPYPGNPFAPTYREPWINPGKRRAAGLAALAAAAVLLGGGFALGAATNGDRGGPNRGGFERTGDGRQLGPAGRDGANVNPGRGHRFDRPPAAPSAVTSVPGATSVPAATSSAPAPGTTSPSR